MCTPGAQIPVPFDELASLLCRSQVNLIRRERELFRGAEVGGQGHRSDMVLAKHFLGLHQGQVALDDEVGVDAVVPVPVQTVWDGVIGTWVNAQRHPGWIQRVGPHPGVAGVDDCLFVWRVDRWWDGAEVWASLTAGGSASPAGRRCLIVRHFSNRFGIFSRWKCVGFLFWELLGVGRIGDHMPLATEINIYARRPQSK